jgi:hypothetical protein
MNSFPNCQGRFAPFSLFHDGAKNKSTIAAIDYPYCTAATWGHQNPGKRDASIWNPFTTCFDAHTVVVKLTWYKRGYHSHKTTSKILAYFHYVLAFITWTNDRMSEQCSLRLPFFCDRRISLSVVRRPSICDI